MARKARWFPPLLRVLVLIALLSPISSSVPQHNARALRPSVEAFEHLPLVFEPNRGQAERSATFVARGAGYAVAIDVHGARVGLRGGPHSAAHLLQMRVALSSDRATAVATAPLPGLSHYFFGHGRDPLIDIPQFASVSVRDVYPGIDLTYYGNQRRLEYDFIVSPGANPRGIQLQFTGHDSMEISPEGDLVFRWGARSLRQRKPVLYQLPDRKPVQGSFVLTGDGMVGFDVAGWDRTKTLVIDPMIVFGTYLGGSLADTATSVAVDLSGNTYVGGTTASMDFPIVDAHQGANAGGSTDAFVTKLNAAGTAILYSTYLGGDAADEGRGIAVDTSGSAYLVGSTLSGNFPTTSTLTTACGGVGQSDGFITKLTPAGNAMAYSLCFGSPLSNDATNGVALDALANAYVTGSSGGSDAFVGRLNAAGSAWAFFRIVGGGLTDEGLGIAADGAGNTCITGRTSSPDFPVSNAIQRIFPSASSSAFVAKFNPVGNTVFSTYLGGSGSDAGFGAALDATGHCYVVGVTNSTDFPVLNAWQPASRGAGDAFLAAYNTQGSSLYSTYLGGSGSDRGMGITVSPAGVVHIVGQSNSQDLPYVDPVQSEISDPGSLYISTNEGATFSRTALSGPSVQALTVSAYNARFIYVGTASGLLKSDNGFITWGAVSTSAVDATANIVALASDPVVCCPTYAGSLRTSATNSDRVLAFTLGPPSPFVDPWFNGTIGGRAVRSLSISHPISAPYGALYSSVIVNTSTPGLLMHRVARTRLQWGSCCGLFGETDYSLTFEDAEYVVAADPSNVCTVYTGAASGTVKKNTSCGAMSWSAVGDVLNGAVSALAAHPTNQATLLAGTSAGTIYRKLDDQSAWTAVATVPGSINSIVYHPTNPQVAYAAGSGGVVYKSVDAGASWSAGSTIFSGVSALAVSPAAPSNVYVGTIRDYDAFYVRVSHTGTVLTSTWIGGHGADAALGVALNPAGHAVIVGRTAARDFPVSSGAASTVPAGGGDAFVVEISTPEVPPVSSTLVVTPDNLAFRATSSGDSRGGRHLIDSTPAQSVTVDFVGAPPLWTALSDQPWLILSGGAGSGSGRFTARISNNLPQGPGTNECLPRCVDHANTFKATITLTSPTAFVVRVPVELVIYVPSATTAAAVGQVDTPAQGATNQVGAISMTGWAVDDLGVMSVKIYRACLAFDDPARCQQILGHNVVFLGDAAFLSGARPDVESVFPYLPYNYRAGWGTQILTSVLPHVDARQPNGGQGTLELYAFATDAEGHVTLLGRTAADATPTTITMNNDNIAKPFGTADTPLPGATISGIVPAFFWALTPDTDTVPGNSDIQLDPAGRTIFLFVDGVAVEPAAFNQCRGSVGNPPGPVVFCDDDVANVFGNLTPQAPLTPRAFNPTRFRNLDAGRGAIGVNVIDTTRLSNGLHTLAWSVTDSAGRVEGIGSRFFMVLNSSASLTDRITSLLVADAAPAMSRGSASSLAGRPVSRRPVSFRTGYDAKTPVTALLPDQAGVRHVALAPGGRLEIWLASKTTGGYLEVNGQLRDLPIGSHLDPVTGIFSWTPTSSFFGAYRLVFLINNERVVVEVGIEAS